MDEQKFREWINLIADLLKVFVPAKSNDWEAFLRVLNHEDRSYIQSQLDEYRSKKGSDEKANWIRVKILERLLEWNVSLKEVKDLIKEARQKEWFSNRKSFWILYTLYYNKYKPEVVEFINELKYSLLNDIWTSELKIGSNHFDWWQNQWTDWIYLSAINKAWEWVIKNSDRWRKKEILKEIQQFRLETDWEDKIKFWLFTNDEFVDWKYHEVNISDITYKNILDWFMERRETLLKNSLPDIIEYIKENISKYDSKNIELRRKEFLEKYPLEKLKTLTPEEYNTWTWDAAVWSFTWSLNIKWESWLTFSTVWNFCLFFNENWTFKNARIMDDYVRKGNGDILQGFQIFKDDLYDYIKNFDVNNYKPHEFLDWSNNYKISLLLMYKWDIFVTIWMPTVAYAIAEQLDIIPKWETRRTRDIDLIWFDIEISNYLKEKIPDIVNQYWYNALWKCLYDYAKSYLGSSEDNPKPKESKENILPSTTTTPKMPNSKLSLNTILYWVPGTWKTYNTVNYAVAAIEWKELSEVCKEEWTAVKERYNQYKSEWQIVFTTFHQSFWYEDFIEWIKAKVEDNWNINYEVESWIFKNLCEVAESEENINTATTANVDLEKINIFKMSLWEAWVEDWIYDYCIENNVVSLGFTDVDFTELQKNTTVKEIKEYISKTNPNEEIWWSADAIFRFKSWMNEWDLVVISRWNLYLRAIWKITSEYYYDENSPIKYKHFRKVEWLLKDVNIPVERVNNKKFSMQSIYYLKEKWSKITSLKLDELKKLIGGNRHDEKRNYVLIIDEINRWNISKIFWELITLIEPNKRLWGHEQIKVKLPYSQKEFWVPRNLYIIWTMNTADRSIALMDLALRRRFTFREIEPDSSLLSWINIEWINIQNFFDTVNRRIEFLYDRDHLLWHAYFLPLKSDATLEKLNQIVLDKVIPLLQEYFHDDWEKIQLVLWKWLIHSEEVIASDILWTDTSDYEDQTKYTINLEPTAWDYNI